MVLVIVQTLQLFSKHCFHDVCVCVFSSMVVLCEQYFMCFPSGLPEVSRPVLTCSPRQAEFCYTHGFCCSRITHTRHGAVNDEDIITCVISWNFCLL